MPFHSIRLATELPGAARRVELCHDRAKTTVWLQLTNTGSVIGGGGDGFVTALIGAVRKGNGWVAIDAGTAARCRDVTIAFGTKLGDQIAKFQSAITRDWASFNAGSASRWAKGLTIGHDMSSPGFVMKAIKTGFDAINVSIPTYSGLRVKGFTVDEAIDYLQKRALSAGISVVDGGLMDFEEIGPDEDEVRFEDKASQTDERRVGILLSAKARTHGGRFPYSAETANLPFERVIAYGFRGDSRPPGAIKNAGGFNPNYTRPDQIAKAVTTKHPMTQALDLPKFLENQFLGGYVSVSKSYAVAKAFATGQGGTTESAEGHAGWVYCCFVEGGFDIPPSGTIPAAAGRPAIYVPCDEQEIAMPGLLEWADIVGCRKVDKAGRFEGNVYLRRSFLNDEPSLSKDVWRALSGATQGAGL